MKHALDRLLDYTWSPASPLNRFAQEFEQLFAPFAAGRSATARVNVRNDDHQSVVQMELPGVNPKTLDIQLKDRALKVSGQRETDELPEGARYVFRERPAGSFERTILLPWTVNADGVKATSRNGVLTITLPRAEEDKPRQIQIETT